MTMEECEDWMQEKALKLDADEIARKEENAQVEETREEDFRDSSE